MKRLSSLFLFATLFFSFPVLSATPLDGIEEAELLVYPKSYFSDVARIVGKNIRIKESAPTAISVSININRGGMLNYNVIQIGSVELQVLRRAYVLLDDSATPQKSKGLLTRVGVWSGSQLMYDDSGIGLYPNVIRAVTELSKQAGLYGVH